MSPSLRINFSKELDTNVSTLKIKQQVPPKNRPKPPTMTTEYDTHIKNPWRLYSFWKVTSSYLWVKPTDALNSTFIGITTLHVSGSLSAHQQESLAVHRHWYILCRFDDRLLPGAGSPILFLVANGHQICINCTNFDVRLRTPDDGQKVCPKHVES